MSSIVDRLPNSEKSILPSTTWDCKLLFRAGRVPAGIRFKAGTRVKEAGSGYPLQWVVWKKKQSISWYFRTKIGSNLILIYMTFSPDKFQFQFSISLSNVFIYPLLGQLTLLFNCLIDFLFCLFAHIWFNFGITKSRLLWSLKGISDNFFRFIS